MSCRKKIDSKIWNEWSEYTQLMESEVRTLRQDLARTQDKLRASTRRVYDLVRELDHVSAENERERGVRDQQLARILRALLVLESRLKHEQKSIRQILCEKDNVIRNQQLEISRLRRYTKSYIKGSRDQEDGKEVANDPPSLDPSDCQEHDSVLSKDIHSLKCEIMTKLQNKSDLDDLGLASGMQHSTSGSVNIRKTHSFAGSDISKASLTSSENTDASIITTTTDGSPSLLSTEGFCEGESTDVSPGSTLNKSSTRCTPTIVTTDSETEVTMVILEDRQKKIVRSESKDDGMDCNYASDEEDEEPIYQNACCDENNARNLKSRSSPASISAPAASATASNEDCSNNNVEVRISRIDADDQNQDESSGNWYSDPDEDRLNDEMLRHSVYRPNSNHNSVLECVNQILLRDMEDEENILSVPRRFKHRGKIVRFQPARLSDIESVGSEMERRNSDDAPQSATQSSAKMTTPTTINALENVDKGEQRQDVNDNESEATIDGFEATNSEDEFGMRIVPSLDPESGLEEDVDDSKARPIVIIEPVVNVEEPLNNCNITRSLLKNKSNQPSSPTSLCMERIEEKTCLQMSSKGLTLAKNLDYEDIESLPEIIGPPSKIAPALPPKPHLRNNTLYLKKIPSPSFLINETSHKKQQHVSTFNLNNPLKTQKSARSLKFEETPKKTNNDEITSSWKNRFNNVRSSFQLRQDSSSPEPRIGGVNNRMATVTNIVRHFEEFKIEGNNESTEVPKKLQQPPSEFQMDEYDIQQNFEEFNLDECDLTEDPDRPAADGSEAFVSLTNTPPLPVNETNGKNAENNNMLSPSAITEVQINNGNTGNYDSFLEATGLSNKSILTPSRLLSNHKSMLKPKDVKYKSKIKATAVMERHGISISTTTTAGSSATGTTHTKHWTGPFV